MLGAMLAAVMLVAGLIAGCGSDEQKQQAKGVAVKAMQVTTHDVPLRYTYAGQVTARDEVKVQSRVGGVLVEKMVEGGATVKKGQPLFRIDSRQYEAALYNAKANLADAEARLANAQLDTQRYAELVEQNAISKQQYDTQKSIESQYRASVAAMRALVERAQDDLEDTVVVSPVNGRMDLSDVAVGTLVTAGGTTLATVSSVDPVFVQFTMSENEYLRLAQQNQGALPKDWGSEISLVLSNGMKYAGYGHLAQVDRGIGQTTGALSLKAEFKNPQQVLIPGMFARVTIADGVRQGALLIPQRAVQQVLEKTFVTTVGEDNKAVSKEITLGDKVGSYWIVESGLEPTDVVVVEGLTKLQDGLDLMVTMATPEELKLTFDEE
ncbi:MAG: efflux RND transporter periplasmic adaptor subunit [Selenomonadales bacterium]|nr:efflux RND transporter periplasmic adaptor subunit [Selenomonadales bacterium]